MKAGYKEIERLSRAGHDIITIAKSLGIGKTTFNLMRKRDPDAQNALDDGRAELGNELNDLLLKQARDGNTTAMIFLAKGRLHWRDVGPANGAEVSPSVNINITAPMSDQDFNKIVDITPKEPADG